jgi:hypothetical protein
LTLNCFTADRPVPNHRKVSRSSFNSRETVAFVGVALVAATKLR